MGHSLVSPCGRRQGSPEDFSLQLSLSPVSFSETLWVSPRGTCPPTPLHPAPTLPATEQMLRLPDSGFGAAGQWPVPEVEHTWGFLRLLWG